MTSEQIVPLLRMEGVSKRFGDFYANTEVDLDIRKGEVLALLGENGAGKSTLMNVAFGMYHPDAGRLLINGTPVELATPRDAMAKGIGMVHQHFMLVPDFTVAENVVLGSRQHSGPILRRDRVQAEVEELARSYGIAIDVSTRADELAVEQQQQVEILKLLYRGAELLILDEPTAVLGPVEIDRLFATVRNLCDQGHAVVIITHKLAEVLAVADRVAVLRRGQLVTTAEREGLDREALALSMLGRSLPSLPERAKNPVHPAHGPLLSAKGLTDTGGHGRQAIHDVHLAVDGGEIVGVTGVEGNGQTELMRILSGLTTPVSGVVEVDGEDISDLGPQQRRQRGIAMITDDRLRWDAVGSMTLQENLAMVDVPGGRFGRGLLRGRQMQQNAAALLDEFEVSPRDPKALMSSLSGGNQQRVVLARELSIEPKLVLAAHPTRGLDVGASDFVFRQLIALRDRGAAVVMSSGDLEELWSVCDRIVVMFGGRKVLDASLSDVTVEMVAEAMANGAGGDRDE